MTEWLASCLTIQLEELVNCEAVVSDCPCWDAGSQCVRRPLSA
jgi:hypothetical protein